MPKVNPNILIWARKTAGFTKEKAAEKLGINPAYGQTPVERMESLECGKIEPTRPLLLKMAKQYRRPLLTFYMGEPPSRGDRGEDFRTLPTGIPESQNALVDALVRQTRARQSMVKAALVEADEVPSLGFIESFNISKKINPLKKALMKIFNIDIEEFRQKRDVNRAFQYLREKIEKKGVFVLLVGNLGSFHTNLDTEIFRGFALADNIAPFIVINNRDTKAAWSFTLLHELAHLMLGKTGVSGASSESQIEKFCNDVASEILFPAKEVQVLFTDLNINDLSHKEAQDLIQTHATDHKISASMLAYKLFRIDKITEKQWKTFRDAFRERWIDSRDRERARRRDSEGGPSYYRVKMHDLGGPLVNLVDRMMSAGVLSTTRAGKILDVKPKNVQNLFTRSVLIPAGQEQ